MTIPDPRRIRPAAVALLSLVMCSCSRTGVELHPVRGTVMYEGKPADGAVVVFQPANADSRSHMPSGTVGPDGSFTLQTYQHGEGAPVGEYTVLVTWWPANARELDNPKNKLPERYGDPAKSQLRATVSKGNNELKAFLLTK